MEKWREKEIKDKLNKFFPKDSSYKIKCLWQWIKNGNVTFKEFEYIQKNISKFLD
jgi:hypothetical protein